PGHGRARLRVAWRRPGTGTGHGRSGSDRRAGAQRGADAAERAGGQEHRQRRADPAVRRSGCARRADSLAGVDDSGRVAVRDRGRHGRASGAALADQGGRRSVHPAPWRARMSTLESTKDTAFLRFTPGWIAVTAFAWLVTTVVALSLVVYALGPMLQNGDQRAALDDIRGQLDRALGASQSLFGAAPPTKPSAF